MKVKQIILHNVMGIKDLEIIPGNVTTISGKNATGKSSIMSGISAVINGGHDAFLLRKGEEEGEAVIVLDDNTKLIKKFTSDKSSVKVEIDNRELSSPAKYIKELFGSGFNPVSFLSMTEKDRIAELLKTIPIQLDHAQLANITGTDRLPGIDYSQHPLKLIDSIETALYDSRTGINRVVTETEKTIKTLENSLITISSDVSKDIGDINNKIQELHIADAKLKDELTEALDNIAKDRATEIENVNRKYDEKKQERQQECQTKLDKLNEEGIALNVKLAELNKAKELADKQEYTKDQIKELTDKQIDYSKQSNSYTKKLDEMKKLKLGLTNKIKIAGNDISIQANKLFINDLPYDKLNTAARVHLAMAIAEANLGNARFVVVDGAECLDEETLKLIAEEAIKMDIQLLVFAVSEDNVLTQKEL